MKFEKYREKVSNLVIKEPSNGIERFINNFYSTIYRDIDINILKYLCSNYPDTVKGVEDIENCIVNGLIYGFGNLDYFFANTIKTEFDRGIIVWAAPYDKVCFKDVDGSIYWVTGKIHSKPMFWIEEEYWDSSIREFFKHSRNREFFNKDVIESNIRRFCEIKDYRVDEEAMTKFLMTDDFILYSMKSIL